MAILGNLIARSLQLRKKFNLPVAPPQVYQKHTLRQLLERGQYTSFGKHYGFGDILSKEIDLVKAFRERVPVHAYTDMYSQWWHRCQKGEENVSWPGKVRYFALSSGTSESASKHIPVTQDMIRSIKKVGFKQLYSMANFKIKAASFGKGVLMLGGTTSLFERGEYYEGDMSGISAKNMPRWISSLLYKPGQKISRRPQWEDRIKMIVEKAPTWDVGTICGVPAWVQIVLERVMERYGAKNIHEIWPNLSVYIHGGVSLEPYKQSFKKIFGKPVTYIETYMASEGSFGFQARPGGGIKLVLNAGVFFEFVPFTGENFDEDGNVRPNAQAYTISEVKEGVDYAVLLSTCAGAWRYLIGDVIRFTNAAEYEIAITGRTRQFLSLCGEHLSVDNMNKAIETVSKQMNITIREFTVAGMKYENLFAHQWYIGCDNDVNPVQLRKLLDETLCKLNDDYEVERSSALKEVFVHILPSEAFIGYLQAKGKLGAMSKFPRVLKGQQLQDWEQYLTKQKLKEAVTA
ncbi:GH3 auxin-responsive promoter family protein [Nemorincola caseinilytica]|uniref:GH3 auxin-responsive promoter family protein n=1 Tax=Nemorincola caseinilytica TaxID=2054315 RepID=A0ABP8N7S1_9BACT